MEQGRRTDLLNVKRKIDEGMSNEQLWDEEFSTMVHNYKAMGEYKRIKSKPKQNVYIKYQMPIVMLFVGPTGTGKSELAHILAPRLGSWFKVPAAKGSGLYFDAYDGEEVLVIDEMDGNRMKPTTMNELCDKYPNSLPVHCQGNVYSKAKYIIICSNYLPKYWWRKHNISSFMRRISVLWFSGKSSPIEIDDDTEESLTSAHQRRMQYEYLNN